MSAAATLDATALTATIPALRTDRLILREPRHQDPEAIADFMASPRAGFTGGPTRHESWRRMLNVFGHRQMRRDGCRTIEEPAAGPIARRHPKGDA